MVTDVKKTITTGKLSVTGRLVDASNATLFGHVTGENNSEVSIIYKPIAGERPLWDFPDGTLAAREVAAYLFSEFGRFNIVPFTILRDGPFGLGSVQEWVEIDESVDIIDLAQSRDKRLRKIIIFDALINNTDRKIGHLLPSRTGELFVCDHGVCFHEEDKLRTVLWQWRTEPLSEHETEILFDLRKRFHSFQELSRDLLTEKELNATLARINRMIASAIFPTPSEDWPAVPWPPI
jgi:uncharacterized repeat protein (TIGR03843 family)